MTNLTEKLRATAAKSGRRKTAIKQLQRSLTIQTSLTQQMSYWNQILREDVRRMRKERGEGYKEIEKTFYRQAWWWRLWGAPKRLANTGKN